MATEANKTKGEAESFVWWLGSVAAIAVVVVVLAAVFHFFVGVDILWIEAKNTPTAAYWGQLGDFIGGMLNPVLSFFALLAVLISLRSQSAELRAAREEALAAQNVLEQQTKIFREQSKLVERQNFESVFFGILQMYSKSLESISYWTGTTAMEGKAAFLGAARKYRLDRVYLDPNIKRSGVSILISHAENHFWNEQKDVFGSHFLLLKELLHYIDSFGSPLVSKSLERWLSAKIASDILSSKDIDSGKQVYARIVKATFSQSELQVLALYCLTNAGIDICPLVKRFGLLTGIELVLNGESAREALLQVGAIDNS